MGFFHIRGPWKFLNLIFYFLQDKEKCGKEKKEKTHKVLLRHSKDTPRVEGELTEMEEFMAMI